MRRWFRLVAFLESLQDGGARYRRRPFAGDCD
jgi:hypothetical protein